MGTAGAGRRTGKPRRREYRRRLSGSADASSSLDAGQAAPPAQRARVLRDPQARRSCDLPSRHGDQRPRRPGGYRLRYAARGDQDHYLQGSGGRRIRPRASRDRLGHVGRWHLVRPTSRAATARHTSHRRQSLTDACASRGDANRRTTGRLACRLGGLPAMAAPESSLAAAAILALWPGYGLVQPMTHVKTGRIGR